MNEYDKQAQDFLDATNTTFEAVFLRHAKFWPGEKDTRDIWRFTLTRGSRSYSAEFGNSIANSAETPAWYKSKPDLGKNHFYDRNMAARHRQKHPVTAYDVISCLQKYNPGSFSDFCSEYGYDEDSRAAEKTYTACVQEYLQLASMYSDDELALMAEIN